jgi:hypothetical protein
LKAYHRPWWVIAIAAPVLAATLEETPGARGTRYDIQARPTYHSATWITWGPLLAAASAVLLAILAGLYDVRDQSRSLILAFAGLMLVMPVLVWLAGGWAVSRAARRHLERQVEANTLRLSLVFDQEQAQLTLLRGSQANPQAIPFSTISQVALLTKQGTRPTAQDAAQKRPLKLVLQTTSGPVELLDSSVGTEAFKASLASGLRQELHRRRLETRRPWEKS